MYRLLLPLFILLLAASHIDLGRTYSEGVTRLEANKKVPDEYSSLSQLYAITGRVKLPTFRTPLVSGVWFVLYRLTGGFHWVPFFYACLFLLGVLALYFAFSLEEGPWVATLATAFFIVASPHPAILVARASEGLAYFLFLVAFALLWLDLKTGRPAYRLATAFFLSLAIFSRPSLEPWLLFLALGHLALGWRAPRRDNRFIVLAWLVILTPQLAWKTYNQYRGGTFSSNNMVWSSIAPLALSYNRRDAWVPTSERDSVLANQGLTRLYASAHEVTDDRVCIARGSQKECYFRKGDGLDFQLATFAPVLWDILWPELGGAVKNSQTDAGEVHAARIREVASKAIVLKVLKHPVPLLRKMARHFALSALNPNLAWIPMEGQTTEDRSLQIVAWLAGLLCLAAGLWLPRSHKGYAYFLYGAFGFLLHVTNLAVAACFGVPSNRYTMFTQAFLFLAPLSLTIAAIRGLERLLHARHVARSGGTQVAFVKANVPR